MPFQVVKEYEIAAAHYLPDHPSKCRHVHGHNYKIRLTLGAERLDEHGMVLDFGVLKGMLDDLLGPLDHQVINDHPPFDALAPTAEHLAEWVGREIGRRLENDHDRVSVARVEVWETDRSAAVWLP
ncbi:MAG: 6-carboxytetrahydropterin synthase QueD [Acidobacteriota bacterium]